MTALLMAATGIACGLVGGFGMALLIVAGNADEVADAFPMARRSLDHSHQTEVDARMDTKPPTCIVCREPVPTVAITRGTR